MQVLLLSVLFLLWVPFLWMMLLWVLLHAKKLLFFFKQQFDEAVRAVVSVVAMNAVAVGIVVWVL